MWRNVHSYENLSPVTLEAFVTFRLEAFIGRNVLRRALVAAHWMNGFGEIIENLKAFVVFPEGVRCGNFLTVIG
jgi:hypothetical protein